MILKPRISGDIKFKRKWELLGAILGIGLGYPLFLITLLIPGYSTDGIYDVLTLYLPDLLKNINQLLAVVPYLVGKVLSNINDVSISNPYYPITFLFISFIEFPSCLAWIIPGFLIGYFRNKQFSNIEVKNNGWKVFWHGTIFIEITIVILAAGLALVYLIQFIPGIKANEALLSFFGGGIIKVMLFFVSPFFWIGLVLSGVGGYAGTKLAINKVARSEVVIEEVEPEEFKEDEGAIIKELGGKDIWPEEAAAFPLEKEESEIKEISIAQLKEKIKSSSEKIVSSAPKTIKCSKCGKVLPLGAKFCNQCGNKMGA